MKKAIFPGTFEIFHIGHIKLLEKALKIFDFIYIVVSNNESKLSSNILERFNRVKSKIQSLNIKNVEVLYNEKTTVDIATNLNIYYIIRGVRNREDFSYEISLLDSYKLIDSRIEMVLFISDIDERSVSSRSILLKEVSNE